MVIGLKIPFNWVIFRLFNPIYVEKKVLNGSVTKLPYWF